MSTAYFVVLDTDDPGFDTFVDGKVLTKRLSEVNKLALRLGLKVFEDYAFQDLSEFGGPDMEPVWFDAQEGIRWASMIAKELNQEGNAIKDAEAVIGDLEDFLRVFREADQQGLKWHLELDF